MKNIQFILVLCLFIFTLKMDAQHLIIPLGKNQKVESTFSGDINQDKTIHLIYYKERKSKTFVVIPIYYGIDNKVIQLDNLVFNKKPEIISYHQNSDSTLTLLFNLEINKNKNTLSIVDCDLNTKGNTIKYIEGYKKPILVFKLPKKSVLVNVKKEGVKSLKIFEIDNSNLLSQFEIKPTAEQKINFDKIFDSRIDAINTNEYIKHGSVQHTKAYFTNNILKFVHVEKKSRETIILNINLKKPKKLVFDSIHNFIDTKFRDFNSYQFDNKIFYLINTNHNIFVKIIDIPSKKLLFTTDLANSLSHPFDQKKIKQYINKTAKSFYSPTITINKTIENNMLVNIGYVDNRVYNYYNDWWFHHWMWQQQIMMQPHNLNIPSFGPNSIETFPMHTPLIDEEPFQFVLNSNFKIVDNASLKTIRININKDKYKKRLDTNLNIKHASLAFTSDSARSIYYVKDRNEFVISHVNYSN